MREKIYNIVHVYDNSKLSLVYKYFMIFVIALSLIPLATKEENELLNIMEIFCFIVFSGDYILRWITADFKLNENGKPAFIKYPFRFISLIDLLSVFALAISVFGFFGSVKTASTLAVFRIVRIFRYSKSAKMILDVLKKSKKALIAVGSLAIGYILVSAIIVFNVEPDSFKTFFDALYWATVSLTTVGYGDIYPVTVLGRMVAMLSSFFGIAIVALPAGVVTAEYMNILKENVGK